MTAYYTHKQKCHTTYNNYHQDVVRYCGGKIGKHGAIFEYHLKMIDKTFEDATLSEKEAVVTKGGDTYKAMAFLVGLSPDCYQDMLIMSWPMHLGCLQN